jgi:CheY-like chemotaxis protein
MSKRKILVVDDSALVAEAVKAKLEANNYEVQLAFSGEEALEQVDREIPDLMILDVQAPAREKSNSIAPDSYVKFQGQYQRKISRVQGWRR